MSIELLIMLGINAHVLSETLSDKIHLLIVLVDILPKGIRVEVEDINHMITLSSLKLKHLISIVIAFLHILFQSF